MNRGKGGQLEGREGKGGGGELALVSRARGTEFFERSSENSRILKRRAFHSKNPPSS